MITYQAVRRKEPQSGQVKYYAGICATRPLELDSVAAQIQAKCTVHAADVLAVLRALQESVIEGLKDGKAVRVGDLGVIRPTLRSEGHADAKSVTSKSVKQVSVRFYANRKIYEALKVTNPDVKFRSVQEAAAGAGTEETA